MSECVFTATQYKSSYTCHVSKQNQKILRHSTGCPKTASSSIIKTLKSIQSEQLLRDITSVINMFFPPGFQLHDTYPKRHMLKQFWACSVKQLKFQNATVKDCKPQSSLVAHMECKPFLKSKFYIVKLQHLQILEVYKSMQF